MRNLKRKIIDKKIASQLKMKGGKIVVNENSCDGCGHCVSVCPKGTLALKSLSKEEVKQMSFKGRLKVRIKGNEKAYVQNYDTCTTCNLCLKQCHEMAINKVQLN